MLAKSLPSESPRCRLCHPCFRSEQCAAAKRVPQQQRGNWHRPSVHRRRLFEACAAVHLCKVLRAARLTAPGPEAAMQGSGGVGGHTHPGSKLNTPAHAGSPRAACAVYSIFLLIPTHHGGRCRPQGARTCSTRRPSMSGCKQQAAALEPWPPQHLGCEGVHAEATSAPGPFNLGAQGSAEAVTWLDCPDGGYTRGHSL